MSLITLQHLKPGEAIPDSWIALGTHELEGGGKYLKICLPLFVLMWGRLWEYGYERFGWYVPSIRILSGPHMLMIRWFWEFRSDLMGEEQIIYGKYGR